MGRGEHPPQQGFGGVPPRHMNPQRGGRCSPASPLTTASITQSQATPPKTALSRHPSASRSTTRPSMMALTVRRAHIFPHMVHVPSVAGGALSK